MWLPWWLSGKESTCQCRARSSVPGSGSSPGEGNSNPLQYSCLGNPMDRGVWQATVHGSKRIGREQGIRKAESLVCKHFPTFLIPCSLQQEYFWVQPPPHINPHPPLPTPSPATTPGFSSHTELLQPHQQESC